MNLVKKILSIFILLFVFILFASPQNFLFGYSFTGYKWSSSDIPVPYYINSSGAWGCPGTFTAANNSFNTWDSVSSSYFDSTYYGSTSYTNVPARDGWNILRWIIAWPDDPNIIAITFTWYSGSRALESDIVFNDGVIFWATNGASYYMDVQNIATHEIGHLLGLRDLYGSGDTEKTMYGYADYGETKKRSLHSDDIAGIRALYPSNPTPPVLNSITLSDRNTGSTEVTADRTVNVSISASNSPSQMMLSENSNFSGASWQSYKATTTFTLSQNKGTKTVYCKLKNSDGESSVKSDSIVYETSLPVINSITPLDQTSNSTQYTNEQTIKVNISSSNNPTEMILSENLNFSGASWQTYNDNTTFTFSSNQGNKTVYCKIKNALGESSVKNASIVLDTIAPIVKLEINNTTLVSGDFIPSAPPLKGLITEEIGIDSNSIQFLRNGVLISDGLTIGGRYDDFDTENKIVTYTFKNPLSGGTYTFSFQVSDLAGNTASTSQSNLRVSDTFSVENIMNFPNPFNETTNFSYQLSREANVTIKIYTVRGELIKTLSASAGSSGGQIGFNKIGWNGTDEAGKNLANGMYIYLIKATDGQGNQIVKRSKIGISK